MDGFTGRVPCEHRYRNGAYSLLKWAGSFLLWSTAYVPYTSGLLFMATVLFGVFSRVRQVGRDVPLDKSKGIEARSGQQRIVLFAKVSDRME